MKPAVTTSTMLFELACETGELRGRVCAVNRQGYSDWEDFVVTDDFADKTRILLLGDSFTYGMSADIGMSFADMLNSELVVEYHLEYGDSGYQVPTRLWRLSKFMVPF